MNIPKIIHFIWAGGSKSLPSQDIKNIKNWIQKNPDFACYLWIDFRTLPENVFKQYKTEFQDIKSIYFQDIKDMRDSYVSYEIDRLRPNYGASSDLLRYQILAKYGGAYFDCSDVKPGTENLGALYKQYEKHEGDIFITASLSQGFPSLGNDTLICSKGNPLVKEFYEIAKKNYNSLYATPTYNSYEHVYRYDERIEKANLTVCRTGGLVINEVIKNNILKSKDQQLSNSLIKDIQEKKLKGVFLLDEKYLSKGNEYESKIHTSNWLVPVYNRFDNEEKMFTSVFDSIIFEAENYNFLRLNDHVNHIIETMPIRNGKKDEILSKLLLFIEKKIVESNNGEILKKIKRAQLIFDFSETKIGYDFMNKFCDCIDYTEDKDQAFLLKYQEINKKCSLEESITIGMNYLSQAIVQVEKKLNSKETEALTQYSRGLENFIKLVDNKISTLGENKENSILKKQIGLIGEKFNKRIKELKIELTEKNQDWVSEEEDTSSNKKEPLIKAPSNEMLLYVRNNATKIKFDSEEEESESKNRPKGMGE